jgi:hypothetical protein
MTLNITIKHGDEPDFKDFKQLLVFRIVVSASEIGSGSEDLRQKSGIDEL